MKTKALAIALLGALLTSCGTTRSAATVMSYRAETQTVTVQNLDGTVFDFHSEIEYIPGDIACVITENGKITGSFRYGTTYNVSTYQKTGTVSDVIDREIWFTDDDGNKWVFYSDDEWEVGSTVNATMYDNETDFIIYDDMVVDARKG